MSIPDGTIERRGLGPSRNGFFARLDQLDSVANRKTTPPDSEFIEGELPESLDLDPNHDSDHEDTLNPDVPAGGDFKVRFWMDQ